MQKEGGKRICRTSGDEGDERNGDNGRRDAPECRLCSTSGDGEVDLLATKAAAALATSARLESVPVDSLGHRQWMAVDGLGRRGEGPPSSDCPRAASTFSRRAGKVLTAQPKKVAYLLPACSHACNSRVE